MIPIIIVARENILREFLILKPINAAEIPKNNKLKPTINETSSDENIGNNININPKIIESIPALLLMPIGCHLHYFNILFTSLINNKDILPSVLKNYL